MALEREDPATPTERRQTLDESLPEAQLELKDRALAVAAEGITIADARLPDMPLIYANAGFERLTGYPVDEVLGSNCRFLQGPESDPQTVETIRRSIREERECVVEILNYRKDGSTFWNRLSITPVRDRSGQLTYFIGVQSDVTQRREVPAPHHLLRDDRRRLSRPPVAGRLSRSRGPVGG